MEYHDKEVYYHRYCPTCEHKDEWKTGENSDGTTFLDLCDACHDCLNSPYNTDSHKPVYFKEK